MPCKIILIKSSDSLIDAAGGLLLRSKDISNNMAVFPGKRPGHFLRKYLAEKKGSAYESPRIFSMDNFIEHAAGELGFGGPCASMLDLSAVLYEQLKTELCAVIGRNPEELALDSFLPWAFKLIAGFEEIKIELKTAKDLSGYDELLPEDFKPAGFLRKFSVFSKLYGDFYLSLERGGLLTRSLKYAKTAENIGKTDFSGFENIIFAGFFAFTGAETIILKRLSREKNVSFIFQDGPGIKEQARFLGDLTAADYKEPRIPADKTHFYKASDTHGEVFKLAEVLRSAPPPSSGSVIVLPSSGALFPLMHNALAGIADYNISMGYPLSATPVCALIDSLGDLLDKRADGKYFAPGYLKFVFHPYIKNIYLGKSAEASRIIFQTIEETLSRRMNKYLELSEIETDEEIINGSLDKLKSYGETGITASAAAQHITLVHKTLIRPFEKIKDIKNFAAKLLDFISFISENSTASLHRYWAPFAQTAIEKIIELQNSDIGRQSFENTSAYFKLFAAFMRDADYPFPGTPLKGLQVLGFLETRNLKFDTVYFLDANAGILPSARKEDTLLPHYIRQGLGLSTYKTRERIALYYFSLLIEGAKTAHIFYKDNAESERSPFVERLIWDIQKAGGKPPENDIHFRVRFSQNDPLPVAKNEIVAAALKNAELSPSAIDVYLNCGLQFYYRYVLRLSEKDGIADEIQQRDIGIMMHEILHNFFQKKLHAPLLIKDEDFGLIAEEALKVFDLRMKNHGSGCEYLIKRQIERRLKDILVYHSRELAGIKITACEVELKSEIQTAFGKIRLKGRADRIDERNGCAHIVDYKTGINPRAPNWQRFDISRREDWPAALKSVQMPFYVMAWLQNNEGRSINDADASLMLFGGENIEEKTLFCGYRGKYPDKEKTMAGYRQAITTLVQEILDINRPFCPARDEAICGNCPFKIMCSRQWT